jgi:hypothetical protein
MSCHKQSAHARTNPGWRDGRVGSAIGGTVTPDLVVGELAFFASNVPMLYG